MVILKFNYILQLCDRCFGSKTLYEQNGRWVFSSLIARCSDFKKQLVPFLKEKLPDCLYFPSLLNVLFLFYFVIIISMDSILNPFIS